MTRINKQENKKGNLFSSRGKGYKRNLFLLVLSLSFGMPLFAWDGGMSVSDTNYRDEKGRRQGLWIQSGQGKGLAYRGTFKDDMPEGCFVYTRGDTLVAKVFYSRGGYASYNQFFYPDSSLMATGYYLDKQKDSLWIYYTRDGRLLRKEFYEKGLRHGSTDLYDADGLLVTHQEWFRGLRNGRWFERSGNGWQEYAYKLNLSHGPYSAWYPDSTKAVEGQYEEGLKEGKWRFFLFDGTLYKEDYYRANRLTERVLYLSIQGRVRAVSMDTIAIVMLSPQGGKAELLTDAGSRWICDADFETVCGILGMERYFYANKNTYVAFRIIDMEQLKEVEADWTEEGSNLYDGQLDPLQQLGQNTSVKPELLPVRIKTPFPVYLDAEGMAVLRNMLSDAEVEPENEFLNKKVGG